MTQYSISEARDNLPAIVSDAEAGKEVVLTRRGKEVAAVVPIVEYRRLRAGRPSFAEAYAEFRKKWPVDAYSDDDEIDIGPEYWDSLRDRSPGREIDFQ